MFDIAVSELGGVAGVALVVIGPKDLPTVLRTMRQWTSKARSMAREFQSGLDDMVREAELDDLRKAAKQVTDFSIENEIKKAVDPDGSMAEDFKKTEAEMRSEEHTSELQSLMRNSYAVFCLKKKTATNSHDLRHHEETT